MWKAIRLRLFWWFIGVLTGTALMLDIAVARSIDMSKAGVSLWVFLAVGAFIILLQAVPAIIILLSFLTHIHQSIKVNDECCQVTEECCQVTEGLEGTTTTHDK